MGLPAEFLPRAAVPRIAPCLRDAGIEVDEGEICESDQLIGVRLVLHCKVEKESWTVTAQDSPEHAPGEIILMWFARPSGFWQNVNRLHGGKRIHAALKADGIVSDEQLSSG